MKLGSTLAADRYFAPDPGQRRVAHEIYDTVAGLPIVSPHGHVDPRLLADADATFGTPADLFIIPDHYILRMLYSQGIPLEALGVPVEPGVRPAPDRDRPPSRMAALRRQLLPLPGDALRHVVCRRAARCIRDRRAALKRERGSRLRRDFGEARPPGVPAPRALRALQDRDAVHDR